MTHTMKKTGVFLFLLLIANLLVSCREGTPVNTVDLQSEQLKESLEKANRYLTNEEEEEIQRYISRHKLDMVSTGTGLRYQVTQEGRGDLIRPGQRVRLEYVLNDIAGHVIYSSEKDGIRTFDVGCGDVEPGLDEVMPYLRKDAVAKVIIPSHLGYGLQGDHKGISPRSTLIYTLKVIEVK